MWDGQDISSQHFPFGIKPTCRPEDLYQCAPQSAVSGGSTPSASSPALGINPFYSSGSSVIRFFSLAFYLHHHQNALTSTCSLVLDTYRLGALTEPCSLGAQSSLDILKAHTHIQTDKMSVLGIVTAMTII